MHENEIAKVVVDLALKIHKALGPGLLESVYEAILVYEIRKAGLKVERQKHLPVIWDGQEMDIEFRIDLLVEDKLVVELKAAEKKEKSLRPSNSHICPPWRQAAWVADQFRRRTSERQCRAHHQWNLAVVLCGFVPLCEPAFV